MAEDYKFIKFKSEDALARITLNRPPLNWLNIEVMEEINGVLELLAEEEALKLLVFDAEGKAFSVGVDVEDHMDGKAAKMIDVFHGMFKRLFNLAVPTLALVNGAALGGGCELAVYCDMVIASEKAKFGQPEIQLGVFPPIAALAFPKIIGIKKTFELLLSGENISASEALKIGMINKVVPVDDFEEVSEAFISRILKHSSVAIRLTRKAVLSGLDKDAEAGLKSIEHIYMDELMASEDANEGLLSFIEKRKPVWKGK